MDFSKEIIKVANDLKADIDELSDFLDFDLQRFVDTLPQRIGRNYFKYNSVTANILYITNMDKDVMELKFFIDYNEMLLEMVCSLNNKKKYSVRFGMKSTTEDVVRKIELFFKNTNFN